MRFDNKTVAITGAAVGIGRACAVKFASEGASVIAIDINSEKLDSLKEEVSASGAKVMTLVCDVSDENAVAQAFSKAKERFIFSSITPLFGAIFRIFLTPPSTYGKNFWTSTL